MTDLRNALPLASLLEGKYELESVLGSGGFGVVYRARHRHLGSVFAIKEYLPTEVAVREGDTVYPRSEHDRADYEDGLRRFLLEARQLVHFRGHPNIVRCRDYFEANGTAYLVMDFEEGLALQDLLSQREEAGHPLDEAELLGLLRPLLQGLSVVHSQNVLHRDIKPGNIFIRRRDEQPVLLDFGAAKEDFSRHSKSRAPHSPGYAAFEQVEDEGKLGPWTDLYAVGAVLWRIVTGEVPPKVESRMAASVKGRPDPLVINEQTGGGRFSPKLLDLMRHCLVLDEEGRLQSADAALAELDQLEQPAVAAVSTPEQPPPRPVKQVSQETPSRPKQGSARTAGDRKRPRQVRPGLALVAATVFGIWIFRVISDELEPYNDELGPYSSEEVPEQNPSEGSSDIAKNNEDTGEQTSPHEDPPIAMPPEPERFALTVESQPEADRVRLLRILDVYHDGIKLRPGRYDIEVSRAGYATFEGDLDLFRDTMATVSLCKMIDSTETREVSGSCWREEQRSELATAEGLGDIADSRFESCESARDDLRESLIYECENIASDTNRRPGSTGPVQMDSCDCEKRDYYTRSSTYACNVRGSMRCNFTEGTEYACPVMTQEVIQVSDPQCPTPVFVFR